MLRAFGRLGVRAHKRATTCTLWPSLSIYGRSLLPSYFLEHDASGARPFWFREFLRSEFQPRLKRAPRSRCARGNSMTSGEPGAAYARTFVPMNTLTHE